MKTLLTFNAGSSTVKIGLFALRTGRPDRIACGVIDFRHDPPKLRVSEGERWIETALETRPDEDRGGILSETPAVLGRHFDLATWRCLAAPTRQGNVPMAIPQLFWWISR